MSVAGDPASLSLPRLAMPDEQRAAGRRWVLATGNSAKARELQALLTPLGVTLVLQKALGIPDAEEPHPTFVENALAKARHACAGSGLAAIADDSGICVPALGGAPGVRSARYSSPHPSLPRDQVDLANNRELIRQVAPLAQPVACFYYCVIVLMRHPGDPRPLIAEGVWPGALAVEPRGSHGFGYDAHFLPVGQALTAAELTPAHKNQVSHRAKAFAALAAALAADPADLAATDSPPLADKQATRPLNAAPNAAPNAASNAAP